MPEDQRPKSEEPEMLELQVEASAAKWMWAAVIVLILCITAYKMLKLYYSTH
jgi:hypothetical protein